MVSNQFGNHLNLKQKNTSNCFMESWVINSNLKALEYFKQPQTPFWKNLYLGTSSCEALKICNQSTFFQRAFMKHFCSVFDKLFLALK